jgi:hypothetical protein
MKKELGGKNKNRFFLAEVSNVLFYFLDLVLSLQDCESKGAVQPSDIYGSAHLLR